MKRRRGSRSGGKMPGLPGSTVLLLAIILHVTSASDNQCPVECSCLGNSVICKDLQLVGAPNGLQPWTQNLVLKGNKLANLEFNALLHLPKLKELDVSSNVFNDNFTLSLSEEAQLKWLKINKNRLTRIPELELLHLTHLSLSHNMINTISKTALTHYPELQNLDLSGNKINSIQKGLFLAPKLKILNLNSNQINLIEANSFENLTSLQELRLSKNRLVAFKDYLKKLDKLRVLDVNRNEFRQIDALTFKELKSLKKLRLKRNKIETLKDGAFWPLSNLTELQLDFNQLKIVSKGGLFGLEYLQIFTLSHNRISIIEPQAWKMCQNITELDLSHNELNRIERSSFTSLRKLKKLQLNHNTVSYIAEGAFKDLSSLQVLELSSNKISLFVEDATGIFVPLNQLQKLTIAHNQIKSINKNAFNGLSQVTELDLTGNNVTSIQENAFSSMSLALKTLKMNTSALFCDCGLQWLSVWLRTNRYSETRVQCGYPHWLRGMPLTQLHDANFTCDEFPKPRIVEEPLSQMSIKGDKVALKCRATSTADAPLSFTWKHDNVEIRDRSLQSDSEPTSTGGITLAASVLQLTNVTNAHAGRYQCMVSNNYGTTYSAKAKISVLIYPSFSKMPHDIRVTAGSTARLECSAEGLPSPQIAWQKDGGNDFPAARERRMHKMPTDDVLFIIDVKTADSGVYSCTAQNLAGIIIANATLTILETPSFVKPMENKEVIAGGSIVMECMASGSPRPQLSWRKNSSPLQATERHFFTAENQLLIIVNTVPSDAGSYECEMSNSLGSVMGASLLTIKAAPSSMVNEDDMLGLIIITVVCCAVGTSIVWVVIIYQTRRRLHASQNASKQSPTIIPTTSPELETHLYLDTSSQHSKDSGTGDSTNPSNDQLQLCLPEVVTCVVSNEEDTGKVEGDDPLLGYTNHERHDYSQLHRQYEVAVQPETDETFVNEQAKALTKIQIV
ncbi:PREDICTED: leucine-rich repeats and immunoglobulin-like domains protein 3 [Ceratosolen solmsi marchali]|uniref:Leucine-rich repeats and immunoglobulin-like domains protein 3 n=1 Tax=Ceratosolen solmsi marchali TaxID=326594 RepID=A0AAJ6YQ47_9HYME|nr:PREDICTED: leucine-rich repeats and immunoglobulin-like domains protein 3 [Ceratosolen solmsi marchali]